MPEATQIVVSISTEYIKLDSALKMANLVGSGGEAKLLIADGAVAVNNATELRRGRKLYPGDTVVCGGNSLHIEGQ